VIVGPEGGLSSDEAARALNAGIAVCGLGPRILRTETAAIAVLGMIGYEFC
jgi:16S rRNA (uracil1498-N3)-methyltransferase